MEENDEFEAQDKEDNLMHARTFYETIIEQPEDHSSSTRKPSFFSSVIVDATIDITEVGLQEIDKNIVRPS